MNDGIRSLTADELDNVAGGMFGAGMLASAAAAISQHCSTVPATTLVAGAVFLQANQTTTVCSIDGGGDE
ncbi:MAG: hypothetical protein WAK55_18750 [Xanthobacteraceae bacterium]